MRKTLILTVALLAVVLLTGCRGDSPDNPADIKIEQVPYRGATLDCAKQGSGQFVTRACDFDGFYAAHPNLLADPSVGEEDGVGWVEYRGAPLACVEKGAGKAVTRSCDFARYHAAQ